MTEKDIQSAGLDAQSTPTTSPRLDTISILGLGNGLSNDASSRQDRLNQNIDKEPIQVAGIFDFLFQKPKEAPVQKEPEWIKTMNANDEKSTDLSKRWLDVAQKNDPASRKAADTALTALADHLVINKANPKRGKEPAMPTMTDNHGFEPPFSKALEADPDSYSLVKALVDKYNERSQAKNFPGRMEFKEGTEKDGNRFIEIRRFDPRPPYERAKNVYVSPDDMTLRYHIKPDKPGAKSTSSAEITHGVRL